MAPTQSPSVLDFHGQVNIKIGKPIENFDEDVIFKYLEEEFMAGRDPDTNIVFPNADDVILIKERSSSSMAPRKGYGQPLVGKVQAVIDQNRTENTISIKLLRTNVSAKKLEYFSLDIYVLDIDNVTYGFLNTVCIFYLKAALKKNAEKRN